MAENSEKSSGRSKKTSFSIFSVIILALIVFSFILAPSISGFMDGNQELVFGFYAGKKIEYSANSYFARQISYFNSQKEYYKRRGINEQMMGRYVWQDAFNATVQHLGLMEMAQESGVVIPEKQVSKLLAQYFTDDAGNFMEKEFNEASDSRLSQLRESFRERLIKARISQNLSQDIFFNEGFNQFIKQMSLPERNFNYLVFSNSDFPESEVRNYAKEHPDIARKIKIKRLDLGTDEINARTVYQNIQQGSTSFDKEIAKNLTSQNKPDLKAEPNWEYYFNLKNQFKQEDLDAIFKLQKSELSPLVQSGGRWLIIRGETPAVSINIKDDKELQALTSYIQRAEKAMIQSFNEERAKKIKDLAAKQGLQRAARQSDMTVKESGFFPINYGGIPFLKSATSTSGDYIFNSALEKEDFYKTAFSLRKGEISDSILLASQAIILELKDEITETDSFTAAYQGRSLAIDPESPKKPEDPSKGQYDFSQYLDQSIERNFVQYQSTELDRYIKDSKNFVNNFDKAITKVFKQ